MKSMFSFGIRKNSFSYSMVATKHIGAGTVLESCPTLPLPFPSLPLLEQTTLAPYILYEENKGYIPFGYLGYLLRSSQGNVVRDFPKSSEVIFRAAGDIQKGEVLMIQGIPTENIDDSSLQPEISPLSLPFVVDASPVLKLRGLVADRHIMGGSIIEQCPVISFPLVERQIVLQTLLSNYVFEYVNESVAFAFGYGSLMNHSYDPNAFFRIVNNGWITFFARKNILPGEEITVPYEGFNKTGEAVRINPRYFDFDRQIR